LSPRKVVRGMIQSSPKLRVYLLSNTYVAGPKTLYDSTHPRDSPTWYSIMQAKNVLKIVFLGKRDQEYLLLVLSLEIP